MSHRMAVCYMQDSEDHYYLIKCAIENDCFVRNVGSEHLPEAETRTNWLFDFRAVLFRSHILNAYSELFWEKHKDLPSFQVCGIEMAAIPLVAAVLMKFEERGRTLNGFVIRKSRKKTGLLKMVEGEVTDEPVVVLDDLINSGSSVERQIEIIEGLQREILEVFTILRFRDADGYPHLRERGIPLVSLFELNDFSDSLRVNNIAPTETKSIESPFEKTILWQFSGGAPNFFYVVPKSGPVVAGEMVFFGTDDGTFFARKVATGEGVWSYKVPFGSAGKFVLSTPAIYQDLVFFGAYDGNLYALDVRTGKLIWVFMEADWIGSSPCVADDLEMVFIGLEFGLFRKQGGIVGIEARTGKKVWEHRVPELTHGSPAYSRRFSVVVCGSNDGVLYCLDARSGALRWQYQTEGAIKYAPAFSEEEEVVVVLGHGEVVYVLDVRTGAVVSSYAMQAGGYSTPLVVGGRSICASLDKHVHCFDLRTGTPVWKYDTGARCFASPLLVEGKVYVGSNNGRLHEIDPETGVVAGMFRTRERIVNKIAYDPRTRIFLVPTFANELFALRKALAQ